MARACRIYHAGPRWSDPLHGISTLMKEVHQRRVERNKRRLERIAEKEAKKAPKDPETELET